MIRNKKGEHSKSSGVRLLLPIIIVLAGFLLWIFIFGNVGKAMQGAEEGYCKELLKTRRATTDIGWVVGPAITRSSFFYVSPACARMYEAPCADNTDCTERIQESIAYCRELQNSEPETSRPCMTALEIGSTASLDLCKNDVCGTGENCNMPEDREDLQKITVPNSIIKYEAVAGNIPEPEICPQTGSSISIKYDASSIIVTCMGTNNDGTSLCEAKT